MSLYNMVCATNPKRISALLNIINLDPTTIPRLRDVYLKDGIVIVYTRTGGGNRDGYQEENAALVAHPGYIRDYDDDFDCTYAHWEFAVPDEFKDVVAQAPTEATPREKFEAALDAMKRP